MFPNRSLMLPLTLTLLITLHLRLTQAQYDDDPTARKLNLEDLEVEQEQRLLQRHRQQQHQQLSFSPSTDTNKYFTTAARNRNFLTQPTQIQSHANALAQTHTQPINRVQAQAPVVEANGPLFQPQLSLTLNNQQNDHRHAAASTAERLPQAFAVTTNRADVREHLYRLVPVSRAPLTAPPSGFDYKRLVDRSPPRIAINANVGGDNAFDYNDGNVNKPNAVEQNFYSRETELLQQEQQRQQQQQQQQQQQKHAFGLKQSLTEYQIVPPLALTRESSVAYNDANAIATNKPYPRRQQRQYQHQHPAHQQQQQQQQQQLQLQFHQPYEFESSLNAVTTLQYAPPGVQYLTSNALLEIPLSSSANDDADINEYSRPIASSAPYTAPRTASVSARTSRNRRPQSNQLAYAPKRPESATLSSPTLPFPPSFVSITTRRPTGVAAPEAQELPNNSFQLHDSGTDTGTGSGTGTGTGISSSTSASREVPPKSLGLDSLPDFFAQRQSNSLLDSYIPSWVVMGKLLQQQQQQQLQKHQQQPEQQHHHHHQILYINGHNLVTPLHLQQQFKRESVDKTVQAVPK